METCPLCGDTWENLGKHWSISPECDFPELTDDQVSTIRGMLLCGSTIVEGKNLAVRHKCPYQMFVESIVERLDWMGFVMRETKLYERYSDRDRGFTWGAQTRRHPRVADIALGDWVGPFTKLTAGLYFARHGRLFWRNISEQPYCHLDVTHLIPEEDGGSRVSERQDVEGYRPAERLLSALRSIPEIEYIPDNMDDVEPPEYTGIEPRRNNHLYITLGQWDTKRFIDWLGEPIPPYEYKWCYESHTQFRDAYELSPVGIEHFWD